jgi:Leucine-rich repeat (LRR) protein
VQTNTDRAILVEFYNATNGLGWINKTNWLQGDSPCNWFGVTCDGNNRVTGLSLGSNKLAGTLPASLGDLSGLQVLDMPNNQLSGPIPVTLGSLARVNYFDLSRNQLSGSIPANLGNLLNAITLYLYDNQLSGSIPASLGNLPNIQFLLLYNNQLTGSIPASFGNLTNLRNLRIDKNQLSGCFPVELANLCGKGAYIDMSSNPGLPGGGDFASFCSNRTGACSTPPTTGALALIAPIYDCGTGGITFKTTGGDGSTITYFAPGITGPTTNPNQFVDAGLRQAADAQPLTLSATQSGVTATYRFDLRATCPIGPTPPPQTNPDRAILVELYNSTNGPGWYRKTNWLQGDSPCNWYGVTCDGNGRVTELGLSKDNLTGTLPASIGNLSRLRILALLENKLSGNIPASLGNLVDVQYIFLDNNQFSGSIPASLGNLSEALFLELSNNQLSGSIPSELSNLPNLVSLLLFNNQLTGSIPANLGSLPNLTSLDLSGNQLSGSIPASLGSSKQLSKLTLSNNKLSGCFPAELASLCGKNISMSNNPGLPGNGDFASFCSNRSGACVTPPTTGNLALTAPTYNCATGAITFNTTGGDGSTITYQAPGIIRSSLTSNTGTIEQGLRNDPKPITIQATQSGKTTSYSFDFGAFCKKDDIRLFGVDTTFFVSTYFDYKVGEVTTDQSNPIERWSKTVTNLPPGIYYNFRLLDDLKTYGLYIFGSKDNRIGSFPITITVVNPLYPNLPVSRNLTLTFKSRNPTTGLTLIEPTYNCATGAFRFNTVGGNGTAIEYTAAGITGWTTNPNQFVDQDSRTANDVKPFFLVARQGGTVVNYLWDLKQACGRARVAAEEAGTTLSLQLLGNPVHETVQVLIKGAEGQPVQLRLTDVRGRLLESRVIEQASAQEVQQFKLDPSTGPGMLFLQATKQQQTHTVKIICQ